MAKWHLTSGKPEQPQAGRMEAMLGRRRKGLSWKTEGAASKLELQLALRRKTDTTAPGCVRERETERGECVMLPERPSKCQVKSIYDPLAHVLYIAHTMIHCCIECIMLQLHERHESPCSMRRKTIADQKHWSIPGSKSACNAVGDWIDLK